MLVVVESGTFEVLVGSSTTVLDPGGRVEAAVGENLAARNTGETDGSLLVLSLPLDDGRFAPLAVAGPPEQSPG